MPEIGQSKGDDAQNADYEESDGHQGQKGFNVEGQVVLKVVVRVGGDVSLGLFFCCSDQDGVGTLALDSQEGLKLHE